MFIRFTTADLFKTLSSPMYGSSAAAPNVMRLNVVVESMNRRGEPNPPARSNRDDTRASIEMKLEQRTVLPHETQ